MTPEQNLHTLARRYCDERMRHWHSDPWLREVVRGMQAGIERADFDNLPPVPELAQVLKRATAELPELVRNTGPENAKEVEERERLADLIQKWSAADIPEQAPLPFRRLLSDDEVAELQGKLEKTWDIGRGYWYPLTDSVHPLTAQFPLIAVATNVDGWTPAGAKRYSGNLDKDIRRFLRDRRIERIFQLRSEYGYSYQLDATLADIRYNGSEGFWFSESNDWVVYCSHEGTVTLAGEIAEALNANAS